jgi:hypothetical protein
MQALHCVCRSYADRRRDSQGDTVQSTVNESSLFKVGDRVRWIGAVPSSEMKNAIGTVSAVIPNDTTIEEFTLYDVDFTGRTFTLYGTQIEPE